MAKKDVEAIVSASGMMSEVWCKLVKAVKERGGSAENIHQLATPTGDELINKFAELVVGVKVTVDCSRSLAEMISASHFDYVNPNITEANFPDVGSIGRDFKVYNFKKAVSSDYAIEQMEKDGYQPANLREFLTWIPANWNGKDWVVALGQFWRGAIGNRYVPYVNEWNDERELDLYYLDDDWDYCCRFLAFRKS